MSHKTASKLIISVFGTLLLTAMLFGCATLPKVPAIGDTYTDRMYRNTSGPETVKVLSMHNHPGKVVFDNKGKVDSLPTRGFNNKYIKFIEVGHSKASCRYCTDSTTDAETMKRLKRSN